MRAVEKGVYKELDSNKEWKGTWCAYVDVRSKETGERKQKKKRGLTSKIGAVKIRKQIWEEAYNEVNNFVAWYTWDTWCKNYLSIIELDYKKSTIENYKSIIKKTENVFGTKKLDEITTGDISKMIYALDVISEKRRKKICRNIQTIFQKAVDERCLSYNPVLKIKISVQDSNLRALTQREVNQLLTEGKIRKSIWLPIWIMATFTGMRNGELYALKKINVSIENRAITICEAWTQKDGLTTTKNKKNRVVPISNILLPYITELMEETDSEYLLPHFSSWRNGEQSSQLGKFCKLIGVTVVRFHDLRATFITQLLRSGTSMVSVMSIAGHSSIKVTNRYVRISGTELIGETNNLPFEIP